MLHYESLLGSMYNTPPCWTIYVCGLVFQHMLDQGGLKAVHANNVAKAKAHTPPALKPHIQPYRHCDVASILT